MALVDYGFGIDPLRGKSLGTVFQTGPYGAVIKSKNSSQGQRLRPNLNAQEALSRSSKLFNTLAPSARTDWANAIPSFPTRDRYGNVVLSTARDLFMRTMGRYPISQQFALSAPDSPYSGSAVSGGSLVWDGTSLTYTPPTPPVGEPFSVSLFITRPLSSGQTQNASYFRLIYFNPRFSSSGPIDLTAVYISLFGVTPTKANAIYHERIYRSQTPELLSDVTSQITFAISPEWSYGTYTSTRAIYGDGAVNNLGNQSFVYDNSVTGFTYLAAFYRDTPLQTDFHYMLNIKDNLSVHAGFTVGTNQGTARISGVGCYPVKSGIAANQLVLFAISYQPNPAPGKTSLTHGAVLDATDTHLSVSQTSLNWNNPSAWMSIFRRGSASNRAPGYFAFLQIIDQPLSLAAIEAWTTNDNPTNIIGSFNTLFLADINSGPQLIGSDRYIVDLANGNNLLLRNYSPSQVDPMDPAYCMHNIP